MLETTRAIVLRSIRYGDSKLIIDLLTEQQGRLSVVVSAPKSRRSASQQQLYQPLTQLELQLDLRPTRQLQRVREARILQPYTSIPFSATKLSIALFLAEFLYHATRSQPADPRLFAFVSQSLSWLDAAQQQFANFHLVFATHLSRFLGFYPRLADHHAGDFFDLLGGTFVGRRPVHNHFLEPTEAEFVPTLLRLNYQSMHVLRLSRAQRNRCMATILDYYRLHVANFPELRSLTVLQELF